MNLKYSHINPEIASKDEILREIDRLTVLSKEFKKDYPKIIGIW